MFGLPLEVITMLVSTMGGAFMKMWSQSSADKAEQQKALINRFSESEKSVASARAFSNPNANWIRRFLVISFMAMAGLLFLDFTKDIVNYVELEGVVTPEWLGHAILSVVGMYFGSSITSRR
jgi:hypothetical protein